MGADTSPSATEVPDGEWQSDWVPRGTEIMTWNDTNEKESSHSDWERIGQALLNRELRPHVEKGHTQLHELAEQIQTKQVPNADDLRAAWEHLDMVTRLVQNISDRQMAGLTPQNLTTTSTIGSISVRSRQIDDAVRPRTRHTHSSRPPVPLRTSDEVPDRIAD